VEFHFDPDLQCWTLRRYAEVVAAFRDPRFAISLQPVDESAHTAALRHAMQEALLPARTSRWREELQHLPFAIERATSFDLVRDLTGPWCHAAAMGILDLAARDSERLLGLAKRAFLAGAYPLDAAAKAEGDAAAVELSQWFHMDAIAVQAFVAISQTLRAFLSGAWLALLENGPQLEALQAGDVPVAGALEELLRYAGPSQMQFRYLTVAVGTLPAGTKVGLAIGLANRDPDVFGEDADALRLSRRAASSHLAFGSGPHACVGAALVRIAAPVAITKFTQAARNVRLVSAEWPTRPGAAITGPQSIRVA
jgi:cytochrome P450